MARVKMVWEDLIQMEINIILKGRTGSVRDYYMGSTSLGSP
jgi:hypothetical protein